MRNRQNVKWDLFVRVFHWSLVVTVVIAWLSGELDVEALHSWFGYAVSLLIVARFVWGVTGSSNARFATFIYSPRETWSYIVSILHNRPVHYESHNPAGALMVFGLLAVLFLLVVSGLLYEGWGEYEGPLWFMQIMVNDFWGHLAKVIHRTLPPFLLVMIALHLLGVIVATIQHRENFVRAMWSGRDK